MTGSGEEGLIHPGLAKWTVDTAGVVSPRSYYERALATGATPDMIAAVDILEDAGMPVDKAIDLAVAAHRDGKDAEAFARHMVKLGRAYRSFEATTG